MSRWMIARTCARCGSLVVAAPAAVAGLATTRVLVLGVLALALRRRRRLLRLIGRLDLGAAPGESEGDAAADVLVDGAADGEIHHRPVGKGFQAAVNYCPVHG